MRKIFELISQFFQIARKRALAFAIALLAFALLLFPFDDLGEYAAGTIAQMTQGQVSVNFDRMGLRVFPSPGLNLSGVYIEAPFLPGLTADSVGISPDFVGLLTLKRGVSVAVNGILGGDMNLTFRSQKKADAGKTEADLYKISLNTEGLRLNELNKAGTLPIRADGTLDLQAQVQVDSSFTEQPDGDVQIELDKFKLPNSVVNSPAGPVTIPELSMKSVKLRGNMKTGKFTIEDGALGEDGDDLAGKVTGNLELRFMNAGGNVTWQMGGYSLDLNLKMKKAFEQKIDFYLALTPLKRCRKDAGGDGQYNCRLTAPNMGTIPNVQIL